MNVFLCDVPTLLYMPPEFIYRVIYNSFDVDYIQNLPLAPQMFSCSNSDSAKLANSFSNSNWKYKILFLHSMNNSQQNKIASKGYVYESEAAYNPPQTKANCLT